MTTSAVDRTRTDNDVNILFDHCTIIGRNGTAVSSIGADYHSWMQFQNCTISNALNLTGPGSLQRRGFNLVWQARQCQVLSATATRAAFTGCTFSPTQKFVNSGNASNILVDARQSISNAFPIMYWTNILNDYNSRQAAKSQSLCRD